MSAYPRVILDWAKVQTVFVDMDGTLLDLYFDNHFWQEHLPKRYAEHYSIEFSAARSTLLLHFEARQGTLEWYCLDYWSRALGLDMLSLKYEITEHIRILPDVQVFLTAVRAAGKRLVLVTNAHQDSLDLKMQHAGLAGYFDRLITSHSLGYPKEDKLFWERLRDIEPFNPAETVLLDDSLPVLRTAMDYGVGQLVAMCRPDSHKPARQISEFKSVETLAEIMP